MLLSPANGRIGSVSQHEFLTALQKIWRPPKKQRRTPTKIGLAISGGPDSMALAYLFQKIRDEPSAPELDLTALVVDHGHRPDSQEEARLVSSRLQKLGIRARVERIDWHKAGTDRSSRFETAARDARYRGLAAACVQEDIRHLFLGHHEDDQIETVLIHLIKDVRMRRFVRGMPPVSTIPSCYDLFGAGCHSVRCEQMSQAKDNQIPIPYPGIKIYRPLLAFSKARLVSTCEEDQVPYVTDPSNQNPALTTRNALRHILSTEKTPRALQRESLVRLTAIAERERQIADSMLSKLLSATTVQVFNPLSGLLTFTPPVDLANDPACSRQHIVTYLGRLLELVSPQHTFRRSDAMQMYAIASWMFPGLPTDSPRRDLAFANARGVWIQSSRPYFSLCRQPFKADQLEKGAAFPFIAASYTGSNLVWSKWILWDSRYWIRVRALAQDLSLYGIRPLTVEDMHQYRMNPSTRLKDRSQAQKIFAEKAPGKVRYTLPVLTWGEHAFALPTLSLRITSSALADNPSHGWRHMTWEIKYKQVAETLNQLNFD